MKSLFSYKKLLTSDNFPLCCFFKKRKEKYRVVSVDHPGN